ncbi:MAG: caspase family protein [Saprospiraceae bacterium]|nr:caspase family protein [Saprospiraceae bacterium]
MKSTVRFLAGLLFSLVIITPIRAQVKGASPQSNLQDLAKSGSTYAVVIGISNYRDPLIPDLKYADRDAEAFANWLRSPAGYSLPDSSIRFLANQQATTAQMIMAMDWLIEVSRPGDQVYIYFSGHGDVERVTKFNLGYLLTYDSPPAVYGAGAFSLQYLQAILSTLSENEVQVVMITDACRAGKLAGSEVNGTQVTATRLAQQFASEIKILSCQPDEYSLEGNQWGGGRGCFSYHLEDALYGFADADQNLSVDLLELRRYLEDKVSVEAAPQSQVPTVSGALKTKIAAVNLQELASRKAAKGKSSVAFAAIDDRGSDVYQIGSTDTSAHRLYAQFLNAIEQGNLMAPSGKSANEYFIRLLEMPKLASLYGNLKRKFAAALMDEGQIIINKIMETDPEQLDNIWADKVNYDHLHAYYQRAADILGSQHYAYADLKAKEHYFQALTVRKENYPDSSSTWRTSEKRRLLHRALAFDSSIAVIYEALANTFPANSSGALAMYQHAAKLAPNWVLIHYNLSRNLWLSDPIAAISSSKNAILLDSGFLRPYNWIAWIYDENGHPDSATIWRKLYVEKFNHKFQNDPLNITAFEYNDVGNALWGLKEHQRAKEFLLLGGKITQGKYSPIYSNLHVVYTDLFEFDNAIQACQRQIQLEVFEKDNFAHIGNIYFNFLNKETQAIAAFSRAGDYTDLDLVQSWFLLDASKAFMLAKEHAKNDVAMSFYAGESAQRLDMIDTANTYFERVIRSSNIEFKPNQYFYPDFLFVALAYDRLGRTEEANTLISNAAAALDDDPWLYFNLARYKANTHQPDEAVEAIYKALEAGWSPNPLQWLQGTLCDHLLNPIRETDAYKQLVRTHFPKYYDFATRVPGKH